MEKEEETSEGDIIIVLVLQCDGNKWKRQSNEICSNVKEED